MERLVVGGTEYTPALDLDPESLTMTFSGISRPENVGLFYRQVFDWIAELTDSIGDFLPATLNLNFELEYCNSSSQKYFLIMLEKLIEHKRNGLNVKVKWSYAEGDEKMQEDGEDIADAIGLEFDYQEF